MYYETIFVDGEKLEIWPLDRGISISDSGGWIDGTYEDKEAAIMGYRLLMSENGHEALLNLCNRICRGDDPRNIVVADFEAIQQTNLND